MNSDSVRAFHNTLGAIGAADVSDAPGQIPEAFPGLVEIPFEIVVGEKAQFICNRYALGTFSLALEAHPAVKLADLLKAARAS